MDAPKRKLLFLCTGNPCRSQLAEGIATARLGDIWEAVSAGYMHPLAVRVLKETGITRDGLSKSADEFRGVPFDLVVTVCDAAENCPVWRGRGRRVHLGFPAPARAPGSDAEVPAVFRQVHDAIAA